MRRDVELVIKARSEAAKAVESITKALTDLASAGPSAAKAYESVGRALNDAEASVSRQEKTLREAEARQKFYAAQLAKTKAAIEAATRMRITDTASMERSVNQLLENTKAEKALTKEFERSSIALERARTEFVESSIGLRQLRAAASEADAAMDRLAARQREAAAAATVHAKQQALTAAAIEATKASAKSALSPAGTSGDVQVQRLSELRSEWLNAQGRVRDLAEAVRAADVPNVKLAETFGRAQAAARLAKESFLAQRDALVQQAQAAGAAVRALAPLVEMERRRASDLRGAPGDVAGRGARWAVFAENEKKTLFPTTDKSVEAAQARLEKFNQAAAAAQAEILRLQNLTDSGSAATEQMSASWSRSAAVLELLGPAIVQQTALLGTLTAAQTENARATNAATAAAARAGALNGRQGPSPLQPGPETRLSRLTPAQAAGDRNLAEQRAKLIELSRAYDLAKKAVDGMVSAESLAATKSQFRLQQVEAAVRHQNAASQALEAHRAVLRASTIEEERAAAQIRNTAEARVRAAEAAARQAALSASGFTRTEGGPAMGALSGGLNAQRRAMLEAKREWVESEAAAHRLARSMNEVETESAEMATALGLARARAHDAKVAYNELKTGLHTLSREQKAATASVGTSSRALNVALQHLAGGLDRYTNSSRTALSWTQRFRGEMLGLTTTFFGVYAAFNALNYAKEAYFDTQTAENRLLVVTNGNQQAASTEMAYLRSEADRLGFSVATLADEWSKFAVSAQASNFTLAETRKIFTSVVEAGRTLGLGNEQVSRSLVALNQMMGKGVIQMEELRQQLGEHIPGAFATMARAVGVSGAQLSDMIKKGELTSDYLIKFADELNRTYGGQLPNALSSARAEFGRFSNQVFEAARTVGEAGFVDSLARSLRDLNEALQSDKARAGLMTLGNIIGWIIRKATDLSGYVELLTLAFIGMGAGKVGAAIAEVVGKLNSARIAYQEIQAAQLASAAASVGVEAAFGAQAAAATGLTRVLALLKGAWLFLLTPQGFALGLAAAAAGAAYYAMNSSVMEANETIARHERILGDVQAAYIATGKDAAALRAELAGIAVIDAEESLQKLQQNAKDAIEGARSAVAEFYDRQQGASFFGPAKADSVDLTALRGLAEQLKDGTISAKAFNEAVVQIGRSSEDPAVQEFAKRLQRLSIEAATSEERVEMARLVLQALTGDADAVEEALRKISGAFDQAARSASGAAEDAKGFEEAMLKIREMNPAIEREVRLAKALRSVKEEYDAAVKAAETFTGAIRDQKLAEAQAGYEKTTSEIRRAEDARRAEEDARDTKKASKLSDDEKILQKQKEAIANTEFQIDQLKRTSREQEIANALREAGLDQTSELGQRLAEVTGQLYDQANTQRDIAEQKQEEVQAVNDLMMYQRDIMAEIALLEDQPGSGEQLALLQEELVGVQAELDAAIQKAIALAEALGDPAMAANLRLAGTEAKQTGTKALVSGREINQAFAGQATSGVMAFSQSLAQGKGVFSSLKTAFLDFASSFLQQIAQMIIQQMILNAIGGASGGGGGGLGGFLSKAIGGQSKHTGGVSGQGPTRSMPAAWFAGAMRMHSGGLAGLRADEIPTLLQRGEEVLAKNDPRNVMNGGGAASTAPSFKVVNAIDAGSFVSAGLDTTEGERAFLNFIKANQRGVRAILGV